jgi:hypothetical protein
MRHSIVFPILLVTLVSCGNDPAAENTAPVEHTASTTAQPVIDPGDGGDYQPALRAADTVDAVDNPFFPLAPGSVWVYEGTDDDGSAARVEVEVLDERREIMGIQAVVVRDQGFADGELAEDTLDFFTQDTVGNVWYLGEETAEYESGAVVSTAGSWEAGVDGALPGIVMPAHPAIGDAYRQEFQAGEAEDMGEVLAATPEEVTTRDWTPLEPAVVEEKRYQAGTGLVQADEVAGGTEHIELVEFRPGSGAS